MGPGLKLMHSRQRNLGRTVGKSLLAWTLGLNDVSFIDDGAFSRLKSGNYKLQKMPYKVRE